MKKLFIAVIAFLLMGTYGFSQDYRHGDFSDQEVKAASLTWGNYHVHQTAGGTSLEFYYNGTKIFMLGSTGILTLKNGETISNATDGTLDFGAASLTNTGYLFANGGLKSTSIVQYDSATSSPPAGTFIVKFVTSKTAGTMDTINLTNIAVNAFVYVCNVPGLTSNGANGTANMYIKAGKHAAGVKMGFGSAADTVITLATKKSALFYRQSATQFIQLGTQ